MKPVFGVVIPTGPGREENLALVLNCLERQMVNPTATVIVYDGCEIPPRPPNLWAYEIAIDKHQPGMEQPRNVGARFLERVSDDHHLGITHVAFLDSDIIFEPDWLAQYEAAITNGGTAGVYYGPYEWMDPGVRTPQHELRNDPRTEMFLAEQEERNRTSEVKRYTNDLSKGLGCFSGNLVWSLADFQHVGGFWNELHHGRCEDGELGLRAVAMGVPIGLVPLARGYHMEHSRDMGWAMGANARDVPMLNARHPWVQGRCACRHLKDEHYAEELVKCPHPDGTHEECDSPEVVDTRYLGCKECACELFTPVLFVVEEDGKRFNVRCGCGWEGNTALIWSHHAECPARAVAV